MKRKILILTLCFTIIFTSINFKKSYADMGVISAPMVGVISTVAIASGIVLNNSDEIVEFANMFYQTNKENWQEINSLFRDTVSVRADKVVTIGKAFLDKIYNFLDILKVSIDGSLGTIDKLGEMTIGVPYRYGDLVEFGGDPYIFDDVYIYVSDLNSTFPFAIWINGTTTYPYCNIGYIDSEGNKVRLERYKNGSISTSLNSTVSLLPSSTDVVKDGLTYLKISVSSNGLYNHDRWFSSQSMTNVFTAQGTYDKTLVNDNLNEDGSVNVYVPGNVDSLVGVAPGDVVVDVNSNAFNPPYDLPNNGVVSVPNVSNPSISVDNSVTIPNIGDVPEVDSPPINGVLPSFPSFGDSLDFSPMYLTNVTEKFPFSLPWDIGRLIQKFDVEPVAPIFEVPIVSETITLDLTEFSELAAIVRFFILVGFILSLIFISTKLMA